jgi:tetratricopeptide (TPR) repeat protein
MNGMGGEAGQEIFEAISLECDNPIYWSSLAEILEREGNIKASIIAYKRATALGEGIPAYHFRLASCYWRHAGDGADKAKATAAIRELQRAIEVNPHDVDYRLLLAYWLEKTGRPAEALEEYRRGLWVIQIVLKSPNRIRRHDPAEYAKLETMVKGRMAELERKLQMGTAD